MRDPKRIPKVLDELRFLWEEVPDWRLGQIFCNLQRRENRDIFFYEDDELIKAIKDMIDENK